MVFEEYSFALKFALKLKILQSKKCQKEINSLFLEDVEIYNLDAIKKLQPNTPIRIENQKINNR